LSLDSFAKVKFQQRKAWITLQHQHPEVSKTNLRKLVPAIYIWLYRNDLERLNQNSPILQKPISSVAKVDWVGRDKQILEKAQEAVLELLNTDPPVKISIRQVGQTIGVLALLEIVPGAKLNFQKMRIRN
jgi:hypothetical protein